LGQDGGRKPAWQERSSGRVALQPLSPDGTADHAIVSHQRGNSQSDEPDDERPPTRAEAASTLEPGRVGVEDQQDAKNSAYLDELKKSTTRLTTFPLASTAGRKSRAHHVVADRLPSSPPRPAKEAAAPLRQIGDRLLGPLLVEAQQWTSPAHPAPTTGAPRSTKSLQHDVDLG
jgi:hypothetical protein